MRDPLSRTAAERPWRRRAITAAAGALCLFALAAPQHYRDDLHSANEASRVYAALALVHHGTARLEPIFDRYFPTWRATGHPPNVDVAVKDGHYLPDKAPGLTLLAVPLIAPLAALGWEPSYAELVWWLMLWLAALPSVLGMLWLHRRLQPEVGPLLALVAPAALLGTPWLIYGGLLFGHALCASLVALGVPLALGALGHTPPRGGPTREALLGGLALGAAVLVEYPAAWVALGVTAALALDAPRRHRLPWLFLGALGPALALGAWNTLVFGGPFAFSYGYKAHAGMAAAHGVGAYGLGWPRPEALHGLLVSSRRGLLHAAPWALAGLLGAVAAASDRRLASVWRRSLLVLPLGGIVLMAGFGDWHGGRALGPRYLLFLLPLLAVAAATALARLGTGKLRDGLLGGLAGLLGSSLLLALAGAYGFPYVSEQIDNPLFEVVLPVWQAAGPGPTRLDGLAPSPWGAILGAAAAFAALALLGFAPRLCGAPPHGAPGSSSAIREGKATSRGLGRGWIALIACSALVLHLSLASRSTTTGPGARRRVLAERAFAHVVLGQHAAARMLPRTTHRAPASDGHHAP